MKSDLGTRTLTAIAMVVVAGTALWLGGWFWAVFAGLIATGVLWEWRGLVRGFVRTNVGRAIWNLGGFVYIAAATFVLILLRSEFFGIVPVLMALGLVIAVDVGAYFAGRGIGGPKIAPRISPSKTWAGLGGGIVGAAVVLALALWAQRGTLACDTYAWYCVSDFGLLVNALVPAVAVAVVAQAGDFFESWMKRRAGVKDSGSLLPGHGGLFDRLDGLLAVCFVIGIIQLGIYAVGYA